MLFRIVYIGKTGHLRELRDAARELKPKADMDWIGLVCPDDAVSFEVDSIEEGKKVMKHIYDKFPDIPRRYSYVEGKSWWDLLPDGTDKFLGTSVWNDRFDYERPVKTEDFDKFLKA